MSKQTYQLGQQVRSTTAPAHVPESGRVEAIAKKDGERPVSVLVRVTNADGRPGVGGVEVALVGNVAEVGDTITFSRAHDGSGIPSYTGHIASLNPYAGRLPVNRDIPPPVIYLLATGIGDPHYGGQDAWIDITWYQTAQQWGVTSYAVRYRTDTDIDWTQGDNIPQTLSNDGKQTTRLSGLRTGQNYTVELAGLTPAEISDWSAPASISTAIDTTAPPIPSLDSAVFVTPTQLRAHVPSSYAYPKDFDHFIYRFSDNGTTTDIVWAGPDLEYHYHFVYGYTYTMQVAGVDHAGNVSSFSTPATTVSADTTPPVVPSPSARWVDLHTINVTWTGVSGASVYNVQLYRNGTTLLDTIPTTSDHINISSTSAYQISPLDGYTYTVKVRAGNVWGNYSSYSSAASISPPAVNQATPTMQWARLIGLYGDAGAGRLDLKAMPLSVNSLTAKCRFKIYKSGTLDGTVDVPSSDDPHVIKLTDTPYNSGSSYTVTATLVDIWEQEGTASTALALTVPTIPKPASQRYDQFLSGLQLVCEELTDGLGYTADRYNFQVFDVTSGSSLLADVTTSTPDYWYAFASPAVGGGPIGKRKYKMQVRGRDRITLAWGTWSNLWPSGTPTPVDAAEDMARMLNNKDATTTGVDTAAFSATAKPPFAGKSDSTDDVTTLGYSNINAGGKIDTGAFKSTAVAPSSNDITAITGLANVVAKLNSNSGTKLAAAALNLSDVTSGINAGGGGTIISNNGERPVGLLLNSGFEFWSNDTITPDNWTIPQTNGTSSRESSTIRLGTYSLKLNPNASQVINATSDRIGVVEGATYLLNAYVYVASAATITPKVSWYDNTGALISTNSFGGTSCSAAAWTTLLSLRLAAPTGAVKAAIILPSGSGIVTYWDTIDFQQAIGGEHLATYITLIGILASITASGGFYTGSNSISSGNGLAIGVGSVQQTATVTNNFAGVVATSNKFSQSDATKTNDFAGNMTVGGTLGVTGAATFTTATVGTLPVLTHTHAGTAATGYIAKGAILAIEERNPGTTGGHYTNATTTATLIVGTNSGVPSTTAGDKHQFDVDNQTGSAIVVVMHWTGWWSISGTTNRCELFWSTATTNIPSTTALMGALQYLNIGGGVWYQATVRAIYTVPANTRQYFFMMGRSSNTATTLTVGAQDTLTRAQYGYIVYNLIATGGQSLVISSSLLR